MAELLPPEDFTAQLVQDFETADSDDDMLSQVDEREFENGPPSISSPKSAPPTNSRFVLYSDAELQRFTHEQENPSTTRKTLAHVKLFVDFIAMKDERRPIHTIPPNELDPLLESFYVGVRKSDGSQYEPCYVKNIQRSIERHLKNRNY
jgi:hypothetical protein